MTKSTMVTDQVAVLPAKDREVVDEFSKVLRRHRGQGAARLAELARVTFDVVLTSVSNPTRESKAALALVRGLEARQQLIESEGGSLSSDEAARLLGISKTAVFKRLEAGKLLAWEEERLGARRFPAWQFDEQGRVLGGLVEVLEVLNANPHLDDWARVLFFLQSKPRLAGKRPLDLLRKGRVKEVSQAAHAYAE